MLVRSTGADGVLVLRLCGRTGERVQAEQGGCGPDARPMGELWIICCENANVANVAAVLTKEMPGAFDFLPALREAADSSHHNADF
jgi:hypothetical protein